LFWLHQLAVKVTLRWFHCSAEQKTSFFLVQQKISKRCHRKTEFFLHTLFIKNEERTRGKNTGRCFSIQLKTTSKNSGTFEEKKKIVT